MPIYKQYEQASLDRQYNNRLQVPDYTTYLERWESLSRQTEKEFTVIKDIAYGELLREKLDIYPSPLAQSKTLIFIHGGYWQRLDKADFQFIARGFIKYNITTVLITYPLAPTVTIDQIVLSCRKAIHWLHENLISFNGDPYQIYVAGHSAGAHLATMLLATDWDKFNLKTDIIKGACGLSGLYNLIPISLSDINEALKMDKETALRNSPVQLNPQTQCPLIISVGSDESNEYKEQSRELYDCWKNKDLSVQLLELPGLNHYSILEPTIDPTSILHKAVCQLLKI